MTIATHAIVQTAVAVRSRTEAVARLADLFAAVPIAHDVGVEQAKEDGTVFAFRNNTYFEVLDPLHENHTRARFLRCNGPGIYMLSCSLEDQPIDEIKDDLSRNSIRSVLEGPWGWNHKYRWHLHPKDCGDLLILTSLMKQTYNNECWAGTHFADDVGYNTRFVGEICGLVARTRDAASECEVFGRIGFRMEDVGGGSFSWTRPTGSIFELRPSDAWPGEDVAARRDYAVAIEASNRSALLERTAKLHLKFDIPVRGGLLSNIDPVLGCRFLILDN